MLRFALAALVLSGCAPVTPPTARPRGGDWLQEDMIANPEKYIPPQAASRQRLRALGLPDPNPAPMPTPAPPPALAAATPAPAASPVPHAPSSSSSPPVQSAGYCPDAGSIARIGGAPTEMLARIKSTCKSGDRIVVPNAAVGLIMMACDENKPTMQIGPEIACALRQ